MNEPAMTIKALKRELPWPWIRVFPLKRTTGQVGTELAFVTAENTSKVRDGNIFAWMMGGRTEGEFPVLFTGSPEEITNEGWRGD